MNEKIWSNGKYWDTNDYNKRLSEENKIIEKCEDEVRKLKTLRDEQIEDIWKK